MSVRVVGVDVVGVSVIDGVSGKAGSEMRAEAQTPAEMAQTVRHPAYPDWQGPERLYKIGSIEFYGFGSVVVRWCCAGREKQRPILLFEILSLALHPTDVDGIRIGLRPIERVGSNVGEADSQPLAGAWASVGMTTRTGVDGTTKYVTVFIVTARSPNRKGM